MSVTDRGRYCDTCRKVVIDFTLMSDGQVLDIFKRAKDNPPCGRFLNTQLDRPLIDKDHKPSFSALVAKRIAAALILLQSLTTEVLAQQIKKHTPVPQQVYKDKQKVKAERIIRGRVVDGTCSGALTSVDIYIKNTGIKTVTDSSGRFSFILPDSLHSPEIQLEGKQKGQLVTQLTINIAANAGREVVMQQQSVHPTTTEITDIVSVAPAIYQRMGGGRINTDAGRSSGYLYVIDGVEVPSEHKSLWQRVTKPFRKKTMTNESK